MTTNKLLYAAETWDRVYKAFEEVNFTAYDYDSVKQSLLDYLKLNYPENFNDYIESSQIIALIEVFAYVAEQHSYRVDMTAHENLMPTAQRKQSILRLAKLISYTASRNLPLRGLVKISSVSCSEDVRDSQGNSLSNRVIKWTDPSNALWREQFQLVMNRLMTKPFGDPFKTVQVDDTIFQQYEISNVLETEGSNTTSFINGTLPLKISVNDNQMSFELVPADIDENGVFERSPNPSNYFSILYADDGYGDGSIMTGFMLFLKQGVLKKLQFAFDAPLPNRILNINVPGINDVDVWLQEVTQAQELLEEWEVVQNINGQNLAFNTMKGYKKYEIETLEDDNIRIVFGSGDFSEIPIGFFSLWVRSSSSGGVTVSKELITNQSVTFAYTSKQGNRETVTLTVSLVSALQNSAASEDIEHIRAAAPAVYYAQDRMVNGQDYNSYMLQDSSILRLKAVNRTFAGQPKYIEWNDASGAYQNVKVFGDDSRIYYDISQTSETSTVSSRSLIDEILEPALSDPGVYNLIVYAFYKSASPLNYAYIRPRTKFIEDASQEVGGLPFQEKTLIQGALDRHWYGEPDYLVSLGADLTTSTEPKSMYGVVNGDTDGRIYDASTKVVTVTGDVYTLVPIPGNVSGVQESVTRQANFGIRFNPERPFVSELVINSASSTTITAPDLLTPADIAQGAVEETWTIEVVDNAVGTFTVFGSKSGIQPPGVIGQAYDNGLISFIIGFPSTAVSTNLYISDAFIIVVSKNNSTLVLEPLIYKKNLTGVFELIDESLLPANAQELAYDVNDPIASWILIVERVDDIDGNVDFWRVTRRNFELTVESPTTKFWYNETSYIIDPDTKKRVHDQVKLLKSNVTYSGAPLGKDQAYDVVGSSRFYNGEINYNSLLISPSDISQDYYSGDGRPSASFQFLDFIGTGGYVYFSEDEATGNLTPIPTTVYLETLEYVNDKSGIYVRKVGKDNLDFLWLHFAPNENLIDPSTSNLIDMFVMTRGYYARMADYLRGITNLEPVPPTPFELRTSYRKLLESKMISDTVVLHPAKIKLLFGDKAVPELRAKFKLVKSEGSKLTDGQLRVKTLDIINTYFSIENWDFAQPFYATELCAVIHKTLAKDLASVVLVPEFPNNWFGDLLYIRSAPDEVFMTAAELKDIIVIGDLNHVTIRQKA